MLLWTLCFWYWLLQSLIKTQWQSTQRKVLAAITVENMAYHSGTQWSPLTCAMQQYLLLTCILLQGMFRGWWLNLYMDCLVFVTGALLSQQKIANEREMLRSSRSDYSRIDLSAYMQGRVKTCCRMVLDNNHHQVKIPLRSRCRIYEVKELS